ncbi:hypothetical protein COT97_04090 [Candidatus Falkowbacteria bacterium CG10_big_fil_rev_8_21_14_0_10_39_11]|uniref:Uncharacterized protein n=1 Tax=Candidatus Falkowbacteria bacterium CG10_big_fil_rev_8_21_14_0_10_39_11 TaxID=1974565 RepID=A0A2H0V454_9BACT|nr:MAG: hypothetical protein COT97_04090 [Candidatus Falkowbacteria bacterium CG10_big_fil_rev_8_21_14_0_10_39_11]
MPNIKAFKQFVREEQHYPAGKSDIISSCTYADKLTGDDCTWLETNLPDKIYYSADEILKSLTW